MPSFMYATSSGRLLLNKNMSAPAAMAVGTASARFMAQLKPTIGVASVMIRPLKPRCPRSSPSISSRDKVAGTVPSGSAGFSLCRQAG